MCAWRLSRALEASRRPRARPVVHERELENTLQCIENGHLTLGCSISRDFEFIGFDNFGDGGSGLFCFRLCVNNVSRRSSQT